MPPGVPPLVLFRTMAKSPRVFAKMFAGGLLDKGPLSLRQREIVIDRTTARLGCEYEWGVHIALFAERSASARACGRDRRGAERCRLLDAGGAGADRPGRRPGRPAHHRRRRPGAALAAHFDEAQILEAIALVGYYHTISFLCLGLELPLESYARALSRTSSAARSRRSVPRCGPSRSSWRRRRSRSAASGSPLGPCAAGCRSLGLPASR